MGPRCNSAARGSARFWRFRRCAATRSFRPIGCSKTCTAAPSRRRHTRACRRTSRDCASCSTRIGCARAAAATYSGACGDEVDADRFVSLLDEGRALLTAGDPKSAERPLEQALALWRGSPLDDVAYEEFAQAEIARLEELRIACLEALCEARLALGRHAGLVSELEWLVAEHPHRERLRGTLMLALYRSGRQADALAAHPDARRVLLDELGLEPSRALQELEQAILRQEPDLDLQASEHASPEEPEQPPSTPLPVSREARKTVTAVFFAITTSSEQGDRLDPETLRHITARAFDELQDAVERDGGTVETITAAGSARSSGCRWSTRTMRCAPCEPPTRRSGSPDGARRAARRHPSGPAGRHDRCQHG